ncbi:MAG: glycosyl hydrolase [Gammaproteobacteria bacterium]|nr:glycosyl hydrolase [Gammaproteobacteria bacterium]MBU1600647.1 glycosyl hydrolase [Gammaproteobacteria bacterium]MBU2435103.1 glycosyl hydrolase [Gammaproteobacteria bacterium]MBU2448339.1 glycosyl hydrolase [Gammaproteobacteria bacterium]
MKKTIIYLCMAGLSSAALAQSAPPPHAPFALDFPSLISGKASHSAMLTITRAGERLIAAGERGIVLYSTDNGKQWTQAVTPTSVTLTALRFIDAKRGWAVGHMGLVLHTEDGGVTWRKQLDGIQAAQLAYEAALAGGDEKAVRQATFLVTDGPDKPFFDLNIDPSGRGFIVGAYNLIFRTTDGGKTWQDWSAHVDNPKAMHLYGVAKSGNDLYLVGEQGLILRSTDGGEHFSAQTSPYVGTWFGALATAKGLLLYGLRGNAFLQPASGEGWQQLKTNTTAAIAGAAQLTDGRLVLASQSGQLLIEQAPMKFAPLAMRSAGPLTAVVEGSDRGVVVTSLRGVVMAPLATANN